MYSFHRGVHIGTRSQETLHKWRNLTISERIDALLGEQPEDDNVSLSIMRAMVSHAHDLPYKPLQSIDDARRHNDGVAILEGDWGGQIYAVIPARLVQCSSETMWRLLTDLDALAWDCNEGDGASIHFERVAVGSIVTGGMGGGLSTGDIWIHDEFDEIVDQIREVIRGDRQAVSPPEDYLLDLFT